MSYTILTFCSENYLDAFKFSIGSWLKTKADKIVIYTDFDLKFGSKKVEIIKYFEPGNDWIVNVGRKVTAALHYLQHNDTKQIAFLDMDCYVIDDFSEVFEWNYDLAVTRFFSKRADTITSGVWFAHVNKRVIAFMEEWDRMANKYKLQGKGIKPHWPAYEQHAFTDLVRKTYKDKSICEILPLEERIYNCEHDNMEKWKKDCRTYHPKIIHFKEKTYNNKEFASEILELTGANKYPHFCCYCKKIWRRIKKTGKLFIVNIVKTGRK